MTNKPANAECAYCNTPIYKKPSLKEKSKSGLFFCSREHQGLAYRKGSDVPIKTGPEKRTNSSVRGRDNRVSYDVEHCCTNCNKQFKSKKIIDDFCSYECNVIKTREQLSIIGSKTCPKCKEIKNLGKFSNSSVTKDGLQYTCKDCSSKKYSKWVEKNNLDNRFYSFSSKRKSDNRVKLKDYLSDKKCIDCGLTDYRLLVFDHVKGNKIAGVGALITRGVRWEAVLEEIDKCEIRCYHCHILITGERGGFWWTKV